MGHPTTRSPDEPGLPGPDAGALAGDTSSWDWIAIHQSEPRRRPDDGHADKLKKIAGCVHRGSELAMSAYPPGCCTGATRHYCRLGKGARPGTVSTAECYSCVSQKGP
jgi:hypothetical protein